MFEVGQEVVCFMFGEGVVAAVDPPPTGNYPVDVRFVILVIAAGV